GQLLAAVGRRREAMRQIERSLELDPYNTLFLFIRGMQLYWARQYDDAIPALRHVIQIDPTLSPSTAESRLLSSLEERGRYADALALRKRRATAAGNERMLNALDQGFARGAYSGAVRAAAELMVEDSRRGYVNPMSIASLYAFVGDRGNAVQWLTTAYEQRQGGLPFINVDPRWDS